MPQSRMPSDSSEESEFVLERTEPRVLYTGQREFQQANESSSSSSSEEDQRDQREIPRRDQSEIPWESGDQKDSGPDEGSEGEDRSGEESLRSR